MIERKLQETQETKKTIEIQEIANSKTNQTVVNEKDKKMKNGTKALTT
jgi:hypothetical protein